MCFRISVIFLDLALSLSCIYFFIPHPEDIVCVYVMYGLMWCGVYVCVCGMVSVCVQCVCGMVHVCVQCMYGMVYVCVCTDVCVVCVVVWCGAWCVVCM